MNATQVSDQSAAHLGRMESPLRWLAGGSLMESTGGLVAIALGIIGLAGVIPLDLASIAAIVIGASLLIEGGTVLSNLRQLSLLQEGSFPEFSTISAEFFGGLAGVVLGILSILDVFPQILMGVAAIAFGATLLLSASSITALSAIPYSAGTAEEMTLSRNFGRALGCVAASGQVFIGIASLTLGILAVIGVSPLVLELVSFLVVGCGIVFSGSALSGRTMRSQS